LTTKRFTGQYHEAGLPGGEGLSYYNARWYDARLGRFISADTLVPNPANPQAFNRYSYVFNNPLRFTAPSGRCPVGYCPIFDPGPGSGGGSKPAPQKVYAPIFYAMRPPTTYRVYLPVVNSSPNYRPTMAHVQSACPGSIVCLPTSKPTAAIPPLLPPWVPLPTPQPQLRPGPTYTSTPTPTIILTPTPTSTPIPLYFALIENRSFRTGQNSGSQFNRRIGSVNAPALGCDIVGLLTAGIPEKVGASELYGKAVAKSIPGIGYSFAIGPNVSSHFQEDGLSAVIKPGL
jgi:RHS repeat-associated protein